MAPPKKIPSPSSNRALPPHYLVTVEGTYYSKTAEGKKAVDYVESFPVLTHVTTDVPERVFDKEQGKHVYVETRRKISIDDYGILHFLLRSNKIMDRLQAKDRSCVGIREHKIIDIKPSSPDIPLPENPYVLSLIQLKQYVKNKSLPINVKLFNTLKLLREAVVNYKDSPESYQMYEDKFKARNTVRSAFSEGMQDLEDYYETLGDDSDSNELVSDTTTI